MTVATETARNNYIGTGTTGPFAYNFRIFEDADLLATKADDDGVETTLVLDVDYTVTGAGSYNGGSVTLTDALAVGETLSLRRVLDALQDADLPNQSGYYPDVVEKALDRLTMLHQQQRDEIDRSLRLPETEEGSETTTILPPLEDRKGNWLYFDPTTGQPGAGSPAGDAIVSAVMEDVIAAVTRQVAMNLLAGGTTAARILRGDGNNVTLSLLDLSTDCTGKLPLNLLNLTPISVTGAVTATINRVHKISLTSAGATITLPTAVGVEDSTIVLHVLSTNTKTVTIDGNASETIDGETSLTMHKNGTLVLVSDGANWYSTQRDLAPGVYVEASSNSGQVVTGTSESVDYEDETVDTHAAWDSAGTFTAPVAGLYSVTATAQSTADCWPMIYIGGSLSVNGLANALGGPNYVHFVSATVRLTAGQTLAIRMSSTCTLNSTATNNILRIARVGDYA